jgi:hypothetical protein
LNTVLILIRLCAIQLRSARFRCFFFPLYFTTCFGLTGHHQVYKVCLRSLLCFPFHVLDASRCFIQIMLRRVFESSRVFGLCLLNMLLPFSLVVYLLCLVLRVFHAFSQFFLPPQYRLPHIISLLNGIKNLSPIFIKLKPKITTSHFEEGLQSI